MRQDIEGFIARSYRFAGRRYYSSSLFVVSSHQLRSLLALCLYFAASPLLCICNKTLFSGAAAGLPLSCCALQQFTCCCLLLTLKLLSGLVWKRGERKRLSTFASWRIFPVYTHLFKGSSFCTALEVPAAAVCFVFMLVATNRCLSAASISAYQIARCSSIPTALLLEVLGVLPPSPTPSNDSESMPRHATSPDAGHACRNSQPEVSTNTILGKVSAAFYAAFRPVSAVSRTAMERRRQAVRPVRFAAAALTTVGMAAAVADGHTLQLHAAGWGLCASIAGCIYMQLLRKRRLQSEVIACQAEASTKSVSLEAKAKASQGLQISHCERNGLVGQKHRLTPLPPLTTEYCHSENENRNIEGGAQDEGGRFLADLGEEVNATMKTTGMAAFLLIPLVLASGELSTLRSRLDAFKWLPLDRPSMDNVTAVEMGRTSFLLLFSGVLAACLSVCTYTSLRGLSPVACCITGFCRTALQLLLSPLLQKEALSPAALTGCCCCLLGAVAFCLDSIASEKLRRQPPIQK